MPPTVLQLLAVSPLCGWNWNLWSILCGAMRWQQGWPRLVWELKPRRGHQSSTAAGGDVWKAGTRAGCSTKRKHGLCHTVLGNSTHLTKPSVRRCRDGFSPCRNAQLYSLRAILSLHGDGCGRTRYFNFTALPSVHKTAQGAAVDSSVCHRRWIS